MLGRLRRRRRAAAAVAFYEAVLGWTTEASGPEHGGYVMCRVGDRDAAGIGPLTTPGLPPAWTTYLATTDADATAAAAGRAGGMVLAEPFDVADLGRTAVLADTQGAVFGLWQAGRHIGCVGGQRARRPDVERGRARRPRRPAAPSTPRCSGTGSPSCPRGGERYATFTHRRGAPARRDGRRCRRRALQPHWLTYFAVADVDATVAAARARRASVEAGPFDTEFGRMATLTDPWGATFAVMGGGTAAGLTARRQAA